MSLFVQPKTPNVEIWDGPRSGIEGAISHYKADEAFPIDSFPRYLSNLLMNKSSTRLFSNAATVKDFDSTHIKFNAKSMSTHTDSSSKFSSQFVSSKCGTAFTLAPISDFMNALRRKKSEAEISVMKIAGSLSGRAFVDVNYSIQ